MQSSAPYLVIFQYPVKCVDGNPGESYQYDGGDAQDIPLQLWIRFTVINIRQSKVAEKQGNK